MKTRFMVRAAMVAALYATLTVAMGSMAYGPIQFRPSEALAVLPILFSEAVPGLFVGCIIANLLGGNGPWDIWLGSLITLVAAYITHRAKGSLLSYLSPIVLNGLFVSLYLSLILPEVTYWATVLSISLSEAIVVLVLGVPLIKALRRVRLGGA